MNVVHVLRNSIPNVRYGYGVNVLSMTVGRSWQIVDLGLKDVSSRDQTLRRSVVGLRLRVVVASYDED
jgi:hypothetical protein